jgi:hypothetical protein
MRTLTLILSLFVLCGSAPAATIVSQVGDIDGLSPGDPEDTPFLSQDMQDFLAVSNNPNPVGLDVSASNQGLIPYTHLFQIPAGQTITTATLEISIEIDSKQTNDYFGFDVNIHAAGGAGWGSTFGPRAVVTELPGYVDTGETYLTLFIDLAAVPMKPEQGGATSIHNLLAELDDGVFNAFLADDSGLDYSILTIETVPAPASAFVLLIGLGCAARRRS